ncbi:MAG: hypothetical protein ACP5P0_01190 [Hydrogenobacter sp.]
MAMAFFFAPLTALAFKSLKPQQIPIGTALYNYARLMGASIATSLATYTLETRRALHFDEINSIRAVLSSKYSMVPAQKLSGLDAFRYKVVIGQFQNIIAGTYAVQDALRMASYISLLSILITLTFLFITNRKKT